MKIIKQNLGYIMLC